jgi:heme oxygenase
MRALLGGSLSPGGYAALLANLRGVYETMELGLETHQDHPAIRPIFHPALHRCEALNEDLAALAGAGWASDRPLTAPALEYADRIRQATAFAPWRLVAHAYTRYLGDLSGGQIIARIVTEHLGPHGATTAFYRFPGIPDAACFKEEYRAALDALPLDAAETDEVVAESLTAFDLNARLFEALE